MTPLQIPEVKQVAKPEFILTIDSEYFDNHPHFQEFVNRYDYQKFLAESQKHLCIRRRDELETNAKQRQVILYVTPVFRNAEGQKCYLPYYRLKGSGESRLHGNVSVAYGGHVDFFDIIAVESVIDLASTIENSVLRELHEELRITDEGAVMKFASALQEALNDPCMYLLDREDPTNRVHLGVVVEVELPNISEFIQSNESTQIELLPRLYTAPELLASDLPLESWTRTYLSADVLSVSAVQE